jgi:hypothetical protein
MAIGERATAGRRGGWPTRRIAVARWRESWPPGQIPTPVTDDYAACGRSTRLGCDAREGADVGGPRQIDQPQGDDVSAANHDTVCWVR